MRNALTDALDSDAFLDRLKGTADPEGDGVIDGIMAAGQVRFINVMLAALDGNSESLPPGLPGNVANYLAATSRLPPWADRARIERAQNAFLRHGPLFGVVLMASSLPSLYAGSFGGSQILAMTGQLTRNFRRRASETLRFILDAMEAGGLEAEGKGIRTTQKVRLMHASIRLFARQGGLWKAHPEWGAPINQEELAGTLMAFSYVALDGLAKLGIRLTRAEQEDYLHAWKCIGYVLGIREEAMPADIPAAKRLWKAVAKRNFHVTPEGRLLMREHLKFVKEMLPGRAGDLLIESLMRFLMGPRLAVGILGLPKAAWTDVLIGWIRRLLFLERLWIFNNKAMNSLLGDISRELMESLQAYWAQGDSKPFRIPESVGGPGRPA